MVKKVLAAFFVVLAFVSIHADPSTDSTRLNGPDLRQIKGWLAGIYPAWPYDTAMAAVAPVLNLWTPAVGDFRPAQSFAQVAYQNNQLEQYGSGADVVSYNPDPRSDNQNVLLQNYLSQGSRPFFLLYEHIPSRFHMTPFPGVADTSILCIDMDDPYNRAMFLDDIALMMKQVIVPYGSRYITVEGRAVIYLWATGVFIGDFASAAAEAKAKFPVFLLGSETFIPDVNDNRSWARQAALDGYMSYSLVDNSYGGDYVKMLDTVEESSRKFWYYEHGVGIKTGTKKLFIPTFMAAYDDTNIPDRHYSDGTAKNLPLYPKTKDEMMLHAQLVKNGMGPDHIYDPIGPFVVYSEFYEGSAVLESNPKPEQPGRYVGYGTGRLEVVKQFFGK